MYYILNAEKGMPRFITGTRGNPDTKTANTFFENVVLIKVATTEIDECLSPFSSEPTDYVSAMYKTLRLNTQLHMSFH